MNLMLLRGIVIAVLLSALTAGYFSWRGHQREIGAIAQRLVDQAETDKIKRDAVLKLEEVLRGKAAAEKQLAEFKDKQEVQDAKNVATVTDLGRRIAALTRASAGRLRDPNAQASGRGGGSRDPTPATATAASPRPDDATETTGLLSPELTEFLQRTFEEADAINAAYISCRADIYYIRSINPRSAP